MTKLPGSVKNLKTELNNIQHFRTVSFTVCFICFSHKISKLSEGVIKSPDQDIVSSQQHTYLVRTKLTQPKKLNVRYIEY